MWSTPDVLAVTRSAINQMSMQGALPSDYELADLTDTTIVELGEALQISSGDVVNSVPADLFFKALISQIGRVVTDTRSYVAQLPDLFVETTEWGLITEMIKIDLSDLLIDEAWNPNGFVSDYTISGTPPVASSAEGERLAGIEFGTYKPVVNAKIYKKAKGVMAALSIVDEQLKPAFRSASEYTQFVSGLYNSINNTMALKAEAYGLLTLSTGIAVAATHGNEINLLAEYLTIHPSSPLTQDDCIYDADFMRYALMRISETRDNLKRMTAAYNNHTTLTFSADPHLVLLNKFSHSAKFNVRANTYNEALLGVGEYNRVASWQALVDSQNTTPFNYDTASTVALTANAMVDITGDPSATAASFDHVIGVLYDRWAMGITVDKKTTESSRSAAALKTNIFYHSLINYAINDNYPIVTFCVRNVGP